MKDSPAREAWANMENGLLLKYSRSKIFKTNMKAKFNHLLPTILISCGTFDTLKNLLRSDDKNN
jgi:hypothetical protein